MWLLFVAVLVCLRSLRANSFLQFLRNTTGRNTTSEPPFSSPVLSGDSLPFRVLISEFSVSHLKVTGMQFLRKVIPHTDLSTSPLLTDEVER